MVRSWFASIRFKLVSALVTVFLAMVLLGVGVAQYLGKVILEQQSEQTIEQAGRHVLGILGQQVAYVASLTESIASVGESLPFDLETYMKVIPNLLFKQELRDIIAGGGVWPEPYAFDSTRERRGLFWGREPDGKLKYYDDYNDPEGPGYHSEEWYVPSKYTEGNQCFWSKSYMDPYSLEPMVTCTVPMRKDDRYLGVTTVDMRLTGLNQLLRRLGDEIGGYVFALDRNNKFLSFPDLTIVKVPSNGEKGQPTEEYITAAALANTQPRFQPINRLVDTFNDELIESARVANADLLNLAMTIEKSSYQINSDEAKLIASIIYLGPLADGESTYASKRVSIESDLVLERPAIATVFQMPETFWKIVIVMPESLIADRISGLNEYMILVFMVLLVVAITLIYLMIDRSVVNPILKISNSLDNENLEESLGEFLGTKRRDELGTLAYAIIDRTIKTKESEERFKSFANVASDYFWEMDDSLKFSYFSDRFEKVTGIDPKTVLGKTRREAPVENVDEDAWNKHLDILNQHEPFRNFVCSLIKDDKVIWLSLDGQPIFDAEGRFHGYRGIGKDITESRVTEQLLLHTKKMESLGTLAGGIAHDFNNMLLPILMLSKSVLDGLPNGSDDRKRLEVIYSAAKRAKDMVAHILTFARKTEPKLKPLSIYEAVEHAIELIDQTLTSNIKIVKNLNKNTGTVLGDPTQIDSALLNIAANAAHAMKGEAGELSIVLDRVELNEEDVAAIPPLVPGVYAKLRIDDTGQGMSTKTLEHIFDPFFTTKEIGEGTGMGMASAYGVVQKHGGAIRVSSEMGLGTCVEIFLPLVDSPASKVQDD